MTNREAINVLAEHDPSNFPVYGKYYENKYFEAVGMAIKALEESEWIPVSERLPEEWESVLVCYKSQGGMAQCVSERFESDRWSALCGQKPIAWKPLPEPYKGE